MSNFSKLSALVAQSFRYLVKYNLRIFDLTLRICYCIANCNERKWEESSKHDQKSFSLSEKRNKILCLNDKKHGQMYM